jgi:hypothetical protein
MLEDLINAWHDAVNGRDLAAARSVVADPVNVSGPRGTRSITAAEFADWILTSGIRLRPVSAHPIDQRTMVVEQEATWPDNPQTGTAPAAPTTVATLFRVHEGAISTVHRFATLHDALQAAGTKPARH